MARLENNTQSDSPRPNEREKLIAEDHEEIGPLQVCQSATGFYIGRLLISGEPYSRDRESYYQTQDEAEDAMKEAVAEEIRTRRK